MKILQIIILLASLTIAACQYQLEVQTESESQNSDVAKSHLKDIPVTITQEELKINYYPEGNVEKSNDEVTQTYATEMPTEELEEIKTPIPLQFHPENHIEPISSERKSKSNPEADAYIVRFSNINNGFDGYKFGYETSNGISRNEELVFREVDEENRVPDIQGGYEFIDPLGRKLVVTYTAGIDGFKPIIMYL
ncbi:hypothetical protein FQA39_LY11941 [Lamprigera yunnana]|nr:hypothetical protein FQA39_LY11941 [Lamprigera yunnana]